MVVSFEVQGVRVYLKWAKKSMFHIVRDITEATVYSDAHARILKKRFEGKNVRLIRRKK